jgi:peptidoglycan/xylan/chitin deacetylase (PgdA/CDA1 family)
MALGIRAWTKWSLLKSGHYRRRLQRDRFPGVAVLCYHGVRADDVPTGSMPFEHLHVRAADLEAHCRMLRRCCHPISLEQWRSALTGGPPLPQRPVLLTFDDGYRSALTLALPILQRYETPAAVFVCSGPVGRRLAFWHDAVARAKGEQAVQDAKQLSCAKWMALCETHQTTLADDDPCAPLRPDEVRELCESGLVEIGGHTASHCILARAPLATQREEILADHKQLSAWTGRAVSAFAYPNGRPGEDYTDATVGLVREAGYTMAFTTRHGFAVEAATPLEFSRFFMLSGVSAAELAHRLCYTWRA